MYKTPKLKKLKHFPWIEDIDGLKAYCKKIAEGSENAQREGCEVFILPGNLHDICIKYTGGDVFHLAEIMATWFKEHKHEAVIIFETIQGHNIPQLLDNNLKCIQVSCQCSYGPLGRLCS